MVSKVVRSAVANRVGILACKINKSRKQYLDGE